MRFTLLLLPALLGSALAQDCETTADVAAPVMRIDDGALFDALESARRDLVISRTEFKRCAKVEQDVLKDARTLYYGGTPGGKAMPAALSAVADLMEAAAGKAEKPVAKLCTDMAASYRAMARELDGKERFLDEALLARKPADRAEATAGKALEAYALRIHMGPEHEEAASILRRGDPQFRALARNMKALGAAWATLDATTGCNKACGDCAKGEGTDAPGCCASKAPLKRAKELLAKLKPEFADVKTERPPADPPAVPT